MTVLSSIGHDFILLLSSVELILYVFSPQLLWWLKLWGAWVSFLLSSLLRRSSGILVFWNALL